MTGPDDVVGCEACDLTAGRRPLPGGRIHETSCWLVEHCVGPLGLGTLIVKPKRHVLAIADLHDDEASELGPLLRAASDVARTITPSEQVYNCLWSHAGGEPVHIHVVVQPVTRALMDRHQSWGPLLQIAMFSAEDAPNDDEVVAVAARARDLFRASDRPGWAGGAGSRPTGP